MVDLREHVDTGFTEIRSKLGGHRHRPTTDRRSTDPSDRRPTRGRRVAGRRGGNTPIVETRSQSTTVRVLISHSHEALPGPSAWPPPSSSGTGRCYR
jgi:hypothetical protein